MTYRAAAEADTFCECSIRSSQYVDLDIFGKWQACADCRLPIKGTWRESEQDNKLIG